MIRLMHALRVYIFNKSLFEKILSKIEKIIKIFSIFNKFFSKNSILLCVFKDTTIISITIIINEWHTTLCS